MRFLRAYSKRRPERRFSFFFVFNIFFLLLVFIVFLPTFLRPSGLPVQLPRVLTSAPILKEKATFISIFKDNSIFFNGRRVTLSELEGLLRSSEDTDRQVLIKADHRARIGALAAVWDLLRNAGVSKINIVTNE